MWDAEASKEKPSLVDRDLTFTQDVLSMAFSADGTKLIGGTLRGKLVLWDVRTGKVLQTFKGALTGIYAVALSADGKTVAASGSRGLDLEAPIRLWTVATGAFLGELKGHHLRVVSLSFSPDGKSLVSVCSDETVRLWDVPKRKEVRRFKTPAAAAAFSPDGKTLAWAAYSGRVHCWDVATKKERLSFRVPEIKVDALAFSPDSELLATAGDHAVRLWSVKTGKEVRPYSQSGSGLFSVAVSPDGKRLAARGADDSVCVWELPSGRELRRLPPPKGDGTYENSGWHARVRSVAFGGAREVVALGFDGGVAHCWDVDTGKKLRDFRRPGGWFDALAVSSDRRTLATVNREGIQLWSLTTGELVRQLRQTEFQGRHPANPRCVALSPDGSVLVSGPVGNVWDWQTAKQLYRLQKPATIANCLAVSPDGKLLASCGEGWQSDAKPIIRLWEVSTGTLIREIKAHDSLAAPVLCVDFSPDGRLLAAATKDDPVVRLWDVWTGKAVAAFKGHKGAVCCVTFFPDARTLASSSLDTTVLLWDITKVRRALPKAKADARALARAWSGLAAGKGSDAQGATLALAGAGEPAVKLLAGHLRPVAPVPAKRIGQWIADLDDDDSAVREAAFAKLEDLGPLAALACRSALKGKPSAEVRKRLTELLAKVKPFPTSSEHLRQARAVQALELIGSARARALLKKLAGGAEGAYLTRDAQGALRRLERFAKAR
jgi:WD40 repeat protein